MKRPMSPRKREGLEILTYLAILITVCYCLPSRIPLLFCASGLWLLILIKFCLEVE